MRQKKYRPTPILITITALILAVAVSIFMLTRGGPDHDNQSLVNQGSQEWSLEWLIYGDKYLRDRIDRDPHLDFRHTYVPEIDFFVDERSLMSLTFDGETFIASLYNSGSDPTSLYIFTYDGVNKEYILEDEISLDDIPADSRPDHNPYYYSSREVVLRKDVLALVNYRDAEIYIFRRSNRKWSFEQKVKTPPSGSNLLSVFLTDNDALLIGSSQGVYIFQYSNQSWVLENELSFKTLGETHDIRSVGFNDNILAAATPSDVHIFRQKENEWVFEDKVSGEFTHRPIYVSQKSIVFSGSYPSDSVSVLSYAQDGWVAQEILDQHGDRDGSFGGSGKIAFLDDQTLAISDLIESIQIFRSNDDNRWVLSQVISRDTSPRIEGHFEALIDNNNRLENLHLTNDGRLVVVDHGERKMYIFSKK